MSLLSRIAVEAARGFGMLTKKGGLTATYLVVAGGGGGAGTIGGGGGAGGYQTSTISLSTLNTYSIAVGAGGAGGGSAAGDDGYIAPQGSNSFISGTGLSTITSTGGGGGNAGGLGSNSGNGGSGGGSRRLQTTGGAGTSGQGNNGGNAIVGNDNVAGGGGGAGAVGGTATSTVSGSGGAGSASSISGSSVTYAGGGGAGIRAGTGSTAGSGGSGGGGNGSATGTGSTATVNTGGGGGGGAYNGGYFGGGAGGSGIVIISYPSSTPLFIGGTLTTSGGNQIHTFTSSGTLSPITPVTASYLVVAGGGGGTGHTGAVRGGGGGGAGGYLESTTTLYSGATYIVTVGAGGVGVGDDSSTNGSNSVLSGTGLTTLTSVGGGAGRLSTTGASGGSGGGGGYIGNAGGAGTSGQGNNGGSGGTSTGTTADAGGGGGGAGGVGGNGTSSSGGSGGTGGAGVASSITGTSISRAGGGGGGNGNGNGGTATAGGGTGGSVGGAGTPNSGGGGGGKGTGTGGNGGSGTVIISYAGSQVFNGGLVTSSGGNTIHTFNATGALTPLTNNLNNSLRFRSSASASLNRTPTIASNRQKWTWSAWMKRGTFGAGGIFFAGGTVGSNTYDTVFFNGESLGFNSAISGVSKIISVTSAVFRDPSAWYHIVYSIDTTQATGAAGVKIYVNGNQQAVTVSTYTQNTNTSINNNVSQDIARLSGYNAEFFDGYLTDINFIDGQALEPYYFGNNDAYGNWKPIKYTGMYGTNGFYLTFADTSALTTSSNAGLGKDTSGNGNYWATNNISITAGTTYDAMTDVPTNTSATVANYAVLNPLWKASTGTLSSANLNYTESDSFQKYVRGTIGVTSGKWYFEGVFTNTTSAMFIGMSADTETSTSGNAYIGNSANGWSIQVNGNGTYKVNNATFTLITSTNYISTSNVLQVAYDADNGKLFFGVNGTWFNSADPAAGTNAQFTSVSGTLYPSIGTQGGGAVAINFGQRPFAYTPPTGYVALNTYNLPTPTILQGNKYMDANLWTGNGSTQVVVNNAQFKPDFVWVKCRSNSGQNELVDSVRGANGSVMRTLFSNQTVAEQTVNTDLDLQYGLISSINSNGFTVGPGSVNAGQTNYPAYTYVGWQWQAGQGSTSSNTSGSITSTVSVNTTAGFSVVTYTGTGANATVGHGLGVAPAMIIFKQRNAVRGWPVYHRSLGASTTIYLNVSNASNADSTIFNATAPTSSVFSLGASSDTNNGNVVAYCWAEIAGFSKFGSYTGNGSADGPFVFTNFQPKYVMIKCSSTTGNWYIWDTARNTYNVLGEELYSNLSAAGGSATDLDMLSNGFKIRSLANGWNANGATFIYMAFASNPFKNNNAF